MFWSGSRLRRQGTSLWIAWLVVAVVCGVPPAFGGGDDGKVAAKAHYEAATRLYDIREYTKALEEYKAAYLAKPDAAFLFNIGQCYRKLGKNPEALDFFQQYLRKAPAEDPNRTQVEARIRELENDGVKRPGTNATATPSISPTPPPPPAPSVQVAPPTPVQPTSSPASMPTGKPAGVDVTATAPAGNEGTSRPFYRAWWFWTGVGVAVVAGAATVYVLSSRGGGDNVPGGLTLGSRPVLP
jgi:tetratricopeptide (TPR) repeat protein